MKAGSPLGRSVAETIAAGALVNDDIITELVRERLGAEDVARGFILDGFPRTEAQARSLDEMRPPESLIVILIDVSEDAIVRRLSSRRICDACGITQSVAAGEKTDREMCPYCGGNLVRRADDEPAVVRRRLATYAAIATPVLDFYRASHGTRSFIAIDGLRHADAITADILTFVARRDGS